MHLGLAFLDAGVVTFCIFLSAALYRIQRDRIQHRPFKHFVRDDQDSTSAVDPTQCKQTGLYSAYILQNQVTHARLLPVESMNSFTYPTVSLLLSLSALESGRLNLPYSGILEGRIFGYGGRTNIGRLTGLTPDAYLKDSSRPKATIRGKLCEVLRERGYDVSQFSDAWIMTMPAFMGLKGINPLTVYWCYTHSETDPQQQILWVIVLEVHNTFGERHVYILEIGKDEDRTLRWDHQWIIPRQFHVSPFNDRSGFYVASVKVPSHSPSLTASDDRATFPRPIIRIHLLTSADPPRLKLTALLRATNSKPLTVYNLCSTLAHAPIALLLTFPRIAYQAFLLHFFKRLDVYSRPEPRAVDPEVEDSMLPPQNRVQGRANGQVGGGVGWQGESWIELFCRNRVRSFLKRRATRYKVRVELVSSNPFTTTERFGPPVDADCLETLTIHYRSPKWFVTLVTAPSAAHALLLGSHAERFFTPSDDTLFLRVFGIDSGTRLSIRVTMAQRIRSRMIPSSLSLPIPPLHPLDDPSYWKLVWTLLVIYIFDRLEERVFRLSGARFVPGDEPWDGWGKLNRGVDDQGRGGELGSVRRD